MTHETEPEWRTAAALAEHLGVVVTRVNAAVSLTGMGTASRFHARGEGPDREYSPEAQALVARELRSRGELSRGRR